MIPRACRVAPIRRPGWCPINSSAGERCASSSTQSHRESLKSILIANRGEIAIRVGRTAIRHGIRVTTLFTDADRLSQHALSSPFALNLGSTEQYLNGDRIIELAKRHNCEAVHPGYGFLSENAAFAKACSDTGIKFIGPPWQAIEAMGDKSRSKDIMNKAGVPCIPGYHGSNQDPTYLEEEARKIGYPVLLKAVRGGGGKGMRVVTCGAEFQQQLQSAMSEARSSFGDDVMLVEKYIKTPRHIEVQVFADSHGQCVSLGERDCSVQRRHQKILEESPAPNLPEVVRQDLWAKARQAALAVGYEGAGTVEFIFDNETNEFFFMEMNTRLQVEHPVTEMVTGEDLVNWQIIIAQGGRIPLTQEQIHDRIRMNGHAIEARIYAENPDMDFLPSTGKLLHYRTPEETKDVRIDTGFQQGDEVSSHYDPMISKLIIHSANRERSLKKMVAALEKYEVAGPCTNIDFVKRICSSSDFIAGEVETGYIPKHKDELFQKRPIPKEAFMQASIALLEMDNAAETVVEESPACSLGLNDIARAQIFRLAEIPLDTTQAEDAVSVTVQKLSPTVFLATIEGQAVEISASFDHLTKTLASFFPDARLTSTIIPDEDSGHIVLLQQGCQYRLRLSTPSWLQRAIGTQEITNSVFAPMPCKILRVEVQTGQIVCKDQALVVIESMKMETVIRSPQDGRISSIMHAAGDMCKAGTALVKFE